MLKVYTGRHIIYVGGRRDIKDYDGWKHKCNSASVIKDKEIVLGYENDIRKNRGILRPER